jgi:hypothetical protein
MARRSGHGHGKKNIQTAMGRYIAAISFAAQNNLYASGVASFLGVSPAQIQTAPPVQHWQAFAQNVQTYATKWVNNYKLAYGVAAPPVGPVFGPVSSTSTS